MKLSNLGQLFELINTRGALGTVLDAIDRGQPLAVGSLEVDECLVMQPDKLPAGFENALRGLSEEIDTELRNMGVDPDVPMIPPAGEAAE